MLLTMKIQKNLWGVVLLMFANFCLQAQNPYTEFDKIVEMYSSKAYLSFDIQYFYYENLEAELPADSALVQLVKKNNDYYSAIGGVEQLHVEDTDLIIDHNDQKIMLKKAENNTLDAASVLDQFKIMAKTFGLHLNIEILNANSQKLVFSAPEASNTIIELVYNKQNYLLESAYMQIELAEGNGHPFNNTKMRLSYQNYDRKDKPFPYSLAQYVRQKGDVIKAINKYAAYKVVEIK